MFTDFDYNELTPIPGTVHKFTNEGETLTVFVTQDCPPIDHFPAIFSVWLNNSYYGSCSEPYSSTEGNAAGLLAEALDYVGKNWTPVSPG